MGRTRNSVINSIWGVLSRIIMVVLPFISRTVIIQVLGVEYLGLGSLFNSILKILNMAELGVGSAIVFSMYKPVAENDQELICALLNTYRKVYRIIGIVILVIGGILLPFIPRLINGSVPSDINIYLLYAIYLSNSVISYWVFAYKSCVLTACQRNDVISKATIIVHIFMYGFQIGLLIYLKNYYVYAIGMPIFTVIRNIITAVLANRLFPDYRPHGKISSDMQKDISKRVTGLMMEKVAFASRNAFDSIIVSAFLGLELVALYNNYYYVISAVSGLMVAVVSAVLPSIGNSIVVESKEKNELDMRNISFLYMSFAGICYAFFLSLFQPLMIVWVGRDFLFSNHIMIAFSIYFLVEKSENIIGNYYDASGMWWNGKWKGFVESICNLLLNILLCYYFGAFGVVVATLISMLFVGIPYAVNILYKHYYNKNQLEFLKEHYSVLIKIIILGLFTYFVGHFIPEGNSKIEVILFGTIKFGIVLLLYPAGYMLIFMNNERFQSAKSWAKSHIRVLKK